MVVARVGWGGEWWWLLGWGGVGSEGTTQAGVGMRSGGSCMVGWGRWEW